MTTAGDTPARRPNPLTVRLSRDQKQRWKTHAEQQGVSLNSLVKAAVEQHLAQTGAAE